MINKAPRGERLHIGIFGRRNAGKSSLLNAITGQEIAIVSPTKGTTTDPVYKTMELLPIGPVVLVDTPGIDDEGQLGAQRIKKARNILRKTDFAILIIGVGEEMTDDDRELLNLFVETGVQYLVVYNKSGSCGSGFDPESPCVNALTGENVHALKEEIAQTCTAEANPRQLVADLLQPGDAVVLVVQMDESAPKGRLILPQQQVIRDILEARAIPIITQVADLPATLVTLKHPPKLVITDSQVFGPVSEITPQSVGLTSFSILMARYKGVLQQAVQGALVIDTIQNGDLILISEGCTHHRQCDDIGTVKIPRWIEARTGAKPAYTFSSGEDFPDDLTKYKLIIHCGGCMLNAREMQYRGRAAQQQNIPMTNYGVAISHMQGILQRCIAPLNIGE
ncbi:MAG: [FeFe] hydrogenase H-cluster maturation GTPase HydF [Firmicutes bacterium]|nr:[FeFe] hydrogenase H-cluster maturation GTPase HydF [Bacillota bacterium]